MSVTIDALGKACPMPVVLAKQALDRGEADVIVLRHLNVLCGAFVVAVADVVRAAVVAFSAGHLLSSFPQRGFSFFTFSLYQCTSIN